MLPQRYANPLKKIASSWGAFLLLAYQAFFLIVVIPGHTRGVITLDGRCCATGLQDAGCACCARAPHTNPKDTPTPQDRENCAICNLAAHYMPAPPADFHWRDLGPATLLPVLPPAILERAYFVPTYFACGPPPSA